MATTMNESGLILPDGTTQTTAINSLSDLSVTATATELNLLDGVTATTAEINKLDGVTSSIQTQLDAKLASSSYTAADVLTKIKTVDGSGSGLDADTLDGVNSSSFLRSDAADTKTSGDLTFNDNVLANFGTHSDLQIYHNGTNSIINETGTGDLVLATNGTNFKVQSNAGENMMIATPNGAVTLYYDHSSKLATTSSGVSVTGTVAATAFSGDGSGLTNLSISSTFPFYKADGTSDTIAVTNGSFPFYKADGTQDNIGVS